MKKILTAALTLSITIFASNTFAAPFTNGDFETGDLTGWDLISCTGVDEATVVNSPDVMTDHYAKLDDSSSDGVAGIYQMFDIDSAATTVDISFDYYFAGTDNSRWYSDVIATTFAFKNDNNSFFECLNWEINFDVIQTSEGSLNTLASVSTTYNVALSDDTPNAFLFFGIWENSGWCWDSTDTWLGIDNVNVSSNAPVPEPATMLLFGTGVAGIAAATKRRKKRKA